MPTIQTITIRFTNELSPHEIPLFRGAVIHSLDNKLLLFHNHDGDGLRYSYPLIQYKIIQGKAAIVCLGQGACDIGQFFSSQNFTLMIGDRVMEAQIDRVIPRLYNVQAWQQMFSYRINRWLPFNSTNYERFKSIEGIAEQTQFLEGILTSNILSFAKGLGIRIEQRVQCVITSVSPPRIIRVKGVKMHSMSVEFNCNVSLPDYIGLGKHASINCGLLTHRKNKIQETDHDK